MTMLALLACDGAGDDVGGSGAVASSGGTSSSGGASGSGGVSGTGGATSEPVCVSSSDLLAIAKPFVCEEFQIVQAPIEWLPYECHTQGIGFDPDSQRFVITCQDQDGGSSGRVLAFPVVANAGGQWSAESALSLFDDAAAPHPSAIQLDGGRFLVAMARGQAAGPSYFHALSLAPDGKLVEEGAPFSHAQSHVGAVAFAVLDGATHAIGCGWDCATLSLYAAPSNGAALSLVAHGNTDSFVTPGVDENVGAYNSLYLTRRCEDDHPLLFASHDDWLDVWELSGLGTSQFSMSKLVKRQIDEEVVAWQGRPIFYEGMTLELQPSELFVWAAPHDFGTESCPSGTRCMQYVYRCQFGG
jgi:hypothetical protein